MMKNRLATTAAPYNVFAHSDFGLDTLQAKVFTHLLEQLGAGDRLPPIRVRLEEVLGEHPSERHYALLEEALQALSGKHLTKPSPNRKGTGFYPLFEYITLHPEQGGCFEVLSPNTASWSCRSSPASSPCGRSPAL